MDVPRIPVLPISYGNASELLRGLAENQFRSRGRAAFRSAITWDRVPCRRELQSQTDAATNPYKQIWDTFGTIRGSVYPDEIVIIGGHRDAWGPGAADNVSGTVSVLEAARAISEQVKAGNRPKRTIVFATWDAEEWGLIGRLNSSKKIRCA